MLAPTEWQQLCPKFGLCTDRHAKHPFCYERKLFFLPYICLDAVSPEDLRLARTIAETLDGLPLALDQAGAYIEETRCSLADYLQLYQSSAPVLLNERGINSDHPASVRRTFALAFEKVQQADPAAAEILRICSFLAPDAIPEKLMLKGASWFGPTIQALAADPWHYHAALKQLLSYSLIRRHTESKTLTIHRLVQAVLKDTMSEEVQKIWAEHSIQAVNQLFPDRRLTNLSHEEWLWCGEILPHALACVSLSERWNDTLPESSSLLLKTANFLRDRAHYVEAEQLYTRALTHLEQELGPNHPTLAMSLNHLGLLYESQGKDEQAMLLYQRALGICERELGPTHPYTAQSLNSLAVLYQYQGKYAEAEPLFQRALNICEHEQGLSHLDTVQSLNNLAVVYGFQGKYIEAEPLFLRALAIRKEKLGLAHPSTAASLNNLATLYRKQGRYTEAEPLYQQCLSICEQELGPVHPHTAISLNNLALLYRTMGKNDRAEPLLQRALAIREQELGPVHPDIAESLNDIAALYQDQGKHEEAKALLQRAYNIAEQTLGGEHPLTQHILHNKVRIEENPNAIAETR